jgi:hypothetical protein
MWLRIAAVGLIFASGILEPLLSKFVGVASNGYRAADTTFPGLIGGIIGALVTGTIAWIALRTNAAVNIRNKRVDVIIHCNMRYDELYKLRLEIEDVRRPAEVSDSDHETFRQGRIKSYFRRYWGLKSDQLDYWLAGYVDPETLSSWFMSTSDALAEGGPEIGGVGYRQHLDEMKTSHKIVNQRLIEIVDFMIDYIGYITEKSEKYAVILQYIRLIENEEKALIAKLARNDHSRLHVSEFSRTLRDDYLAVYEKLSPSGFMLRLRGLVLRAYRYVRMLRRNMIARLLGDTMDRFKVALEVAYPKIKKNLLIKEERKASEKLAASYPPDVTAST